MISFADSFKAHRERLKKMPVPTLYDMVHGSSQELLEHMIAMLKNSSFDKLPAVNNHVCPHCKNERVSKTEKSCWLCGGLL